MSTYEEPHAGTQRSSDKVVNADGRDSPSQVGLRMGASHGVVVFVGVARVAGSSGVREVR